jgi:hypothetical protein
MSQADGSILGRVLDAAGAPVAGASVMLAASPQPHRDIAAVPGTDGACQWRALPAGRYRVAVHGSGRAEASVDVEVIGGRQSNVEIRLDG